MAPITAHTLVRAVGCPITVAAVFAEPLREACEVFKINTTARVAAFLAQVGHESGGLTRLVENLNYSAAQLVATWPSRFTSASAQLYARQPEKIANHVYGGRMGNHHPGDGWKYRGRGLIQTTGRANYEATSEALLERLNEAVPDFVINPEQLATPRWAALSAGSYWSDHELNALADLGEFDKITRRINDGQHGRADRIARFHSAIKVLA